MLSHLEEEIGYFFRDRNLLRRAMTHRSYANEQADPRPPHNEALEFLGDAVLEFLISAWLLELHPTQREGTLSKMRAYTVSAVNLQKQAARLRLGSYLLLNRGEEKTGGRNKMALLVDSYEALLAAIYLDRGIEAARDFVRREFADTLAEIDPQDLTATDYKTALQERLQSVGLPTPQYAIVESLGPDHRRVFRVELRVNGQCFATGEAPTRPPTAPPSTSLKPRSKNSKMLIPTAMKRRRRRLKTGQEFQSQTQFSDSLLTVELIRRRAFRVPTLVACARIPSPAD